MSDEEKKLSQDKKQAMLANCWDRFFDFLEVIVVKITSGRFLAITVDTFGYMAGVVICGFLAYKKYIEPETFVAVLSTYALLVQKTRENYFAMRPPIEPPKPPEVKP